MAKIDQGTLIICSPIKVLKSSCLFSAYQPTHKNGHWACMLVSLFLASSSKSQSRKSFDTSDAILFKFQKRDLIQYSYDEACSTWLVLHLPQCALSWVPSTGAQPLFYSSSTKLTDTSHSTFSGRAIEPLKHANNFMLGRYLTTPQRCELIAIDRKSVV